MKAIINNQNLKRLAFTASITVLFSIAMEAQPAKEIENSLQYLESLARNTEQEIKYTVPVENVEAAILNLDMLAESTERSMQYKAPESDEQDDVLNGKRARSIHERRSRPVQVETYTSLQDAWLINAGYVKKNRTPAWNKVMKVFGPKTDSQGYADKN